VRRINLRDSRDRFTLSFIFVCALGLGASSTSSSVKLTPVARGNLCVTEGTVQGLPGRRLSVVVPKMRAYVNSLTTQTVEADFTYLGPTGNEARLGSGEQRRQFGLKLRAQDACNLVYVMWRIEPESKLVVSVKSNSGQNTSSQCGNRGYRNVKAAHSRPVSVLHPGEAHALRADMNGAEMKVFVDNALVWEGSVGQDALSFDGPVGIRSDNARLQIELRTGPALRAQSERTVGCRSGADESE
jgi:hypothetical protein